MKVIVFLFSLVLFSCGAEKISSGGVDVADDMGFADFYEQFHRDSAFQMKHISFPLAGIPANAQDMKNLSSFRWNKDSWVLHQGFDESLTGYDRMMTSFGKDIIIEKIIQKDTQIGMVRRFALLDDQWMLIYYAAMNPLARGE